MSEIQKTLTDYNVVDIDITDLVPNVIHNVVINLLDGKHTLFIPGDMTSMQFNNFNNGKGGVFSKDVLHYSKGTPYGKYVLVEQEETNLICRLIEEDEWLKFQVAGLLNGTVKDMPYMLLKEVPKGELLISTKAQPLMIVEDLDLVEEEPEVDPDELPAANIPLFD
jgi:hypothetical protein